MVLQEDIIPYTSLSTQVDPSYILVEATIASMDTDNYWYVACPLTFEDRKWKKKLTPIEDGIWKCQRCNQRTFECEYRYIFQFNIAYHIGKYDLTAFQDVVEQIIDIHALKFSEYGYEGNTKETTTIFSKIFFNRYLFKLEVHDKTFANQKQTKNIVIACDKMDCTKNTKENIPIPKILVE